MHLPDLFADTNASECASCKEPAKHKCSACKKVAYCSEKHQKEHWISHRDECSAYKVLRNDTVGRFGVATRSLEPGELVLSELPVVVGPKSETVPLCLGCYTPVDCTVTCSQCAWPVCGPECEAVPAHAGSECRVFRDANVRFQPVEDLASACPQYECITPLRLLLSKASSPARWEAEVQHMEAHDTERKDTPVFAANQVNTVEFLRKACRLADRFSEEEIHRACGVLDVNGFEIRCANGSAIRGLYPQTAIMSHCCVANTCHSIYPQNELGEEYRLRLRASVRVEKGQELFTSYTHALEPTLIRREQLRQGKYFDCRCARCADPTELGTHLGTLKCSKCDNGVVISTNPLDANAQWKCTHCEFTTRGEAVRRVLAVVQSEIDQLDYMDFENSAERLERREQLYRKYRSIFHPRHACMTSLRHSLSHLYGHVDGYELEQLPDILLERKIELCTDLLKVVDVVDPGYTRLRGLTLYEIHAPLLLHAKSRYRTGELTDRALKEKLEEAASYLEQAVNILKLEDPKSPEGVVGVLGQYSLDQLRASIDSLANK